MILIRSTPEFSPLFPSSYFSVLNREPENSLTTRDASDDTPLHAIRNVQVLEQEDSFDLSMDLPGVKEGDVKISEEDFTLTIEAVRKSGGKDVCKFFRQFSLDKKSVKPQEIEASLLDGVLTVKIPKSPPPKTIDVEPKTCDPPADSEGDTFFRVDMPGVKKEDLKIQVTGDELFISGERKKGSSQSVFKRYFNVDDGKMDIGKMQAFLTDGTLTLTAPMKEANTEKSGESDVLVRTFPVKKAMIEQEK